MALVPHFALDIRCANDAFATDVDEPDPSDEMLATSQEIVRILRDVARRLDEGVIETGTCFDANGNSVGEFKFIYHSESAS